LLICNLGEPERCRVGDESEVMMAGRVRSGGGELTRNAEAAGGGRTATLNLPFVTAQFRMPDLHVPSRDELGSAARGARSILPSRSSALFYGGLAVTAAIGAIEWPVAAAIGLGSALASRRAADPAPVGRTPETAEARGPAGNGNRTGKE
jgi:hypothetical protein